MVAKNERLSVIPLGGLGEIGKNMIAVRYGDSIIVLDCGLIFPEDEMLGIDVVIPDITYLLENRRMVKAIIVTHAHEDHIGALPYVLKDINVPVFGTRLTLGLLEYKLKEHNVKAKLCCVKPRDTLNIAPFDIEFLRVCHSIADSVAVSVRTPLGVLVYTGDFKFDPTPVDGEITDFYKFAELGEKGVLVLLSDSTNAECPGFTMSERVVGETFEETFRRAGERIIVACFASNVHRLQQVFNTAYKFDRKVAVTGRSMVNVVNVACELGYLDIPPGILVEPDELARFPQRKVVIITTGSQGEPASGLSRMAMADHRLVEIVPGDTVIISASPIPGNEKTIARIVDQLFKLGAEVIREEVSGIHVSGHASQEELKLMMNLVKPKYFLPVHGEHRMLIRHARLAEEVGIPRENIFVLANGQTVEFTPRGAYLGERVVAGRILVDGLGVGDVGSVVLRDRKQLSRDGILIVVITLNKDTRQVVAGPDVISRGFVYVRESESLLEEAKEKVRQVLDRLDGGRVSDWSGIKACVRDTLGKYLFERTGRRPMILPIIMEV